MTADDLRTQKALAMLELEEAKTATSLAGDRYGQIQTAITKASELFVGALFAEESGLRSALAPYSHVIQVETVVQAWRGLDTARKVQREAEQKMAVFRA